MSPSPMQGSVLSRSSQRPRRIAVVLLVATATASMISPMGATERGAVRSCTAAIKPVLNAAGLSVRSVIGQVVDDR